MTCTAPEHRVGGTAPWSSTELLTDDLQVLLSVASHVGPAIDTLPAPRRSGCTDRDAAPLQEVAIEVGDALLQRAFLLDRQGDQRFIDAAREISNGYLRDRSVWSDAL